jgi:hypothetical protein
MVSKKVRSRRESGVSGRPVREEVSTDSLKFHPAPPCPTLLRPVGGPPPKRPYGCLGGVAHPQGERPAAVFFPLGYPFPYGPVKELSQGEVEISSGDCQRQVAKRKRGNDEGERKGRDNWSKPGMYGTGYPGGVEDGRRPPALFHPAPPCPTLIRPAGGPPYKRP